jgi:hypothetical protein
MASKLERLVEQVAALPNDQQRRFRELLDANATCHPAPSPEESFKQRLLRSGLLCEIKRPVPTTSSPRPPRVHIQGEPLSETVIKERR